VEVGRERILSTDRVGERRRDAGRPPRRPRTGEGYDLPETVTRVREPLAGVQHAFPCSAIVPF
jgi:hypothetical protein